MGGQFSSPLDFTGKYRGKYDGRNALLEFWSVFNIFRPGTKYSFGIKFIDLDRGLTFANNGHQLIQDMAGHFHVIKNFNIPLEGGHGYVNFSRLLMHTWDTDYISGESSWNGQEYGMFFVRYHD
ncbi:hypothetical protein [Bacillus toyonensis]|uniref:hypothetical protein n=2 Tax=Bacillus cereus group TaxID=86661 RepID=UPI0011456BB2|nr:hypothetical protein [Bacillus toyonensis]